MIIRKEQYDKHIYAMENFNINTNNNIINLKKDAVIIYLDIFDFSNKVKNFNADKIITYLEKFYNKVLPIINECGGKVDKVIGDGIISVFCDIFDDRTTKSGNMFMNAYKCCEKIITELNSFDNGKYKSKAAIAKGEVLFYKIDGYSYDYYEITCIGEPLTTVHRLENEAHENEILFLEAINIKDDPNSKWYFSSDSINLKGLGNCKVNRMKLNL